MYKVIHIIESSNLLICYCYYNEKKNYFCIKRLKYAIKKNFVIVMKI